jgi:hypothetical protein
MTTPLDEEQVLFDRLADGELSPRERQDFLASLDGRVDGWRRCALALLEGQAWRRELRSFAADKALTPVTPVPHTDSRSLATHAERWWAVAACLLLAFGLGWSLHSPSTAVPHANEVAVLPRNAPELPPGAAAVPLANSQDAVTLVVRDIEGKSQRLQLPLVEVSGGDSNGSLTAGTLPAELRDGLQNRGLDLRSRRRFAPLFFEQDQELVPMVIPVDDTFVVPVNRPVY